MAVVPVFIAMGQSNAEGFASVFDLPLIGETALQGPQANRRIYNHHAGPNYNGTTPALEIMDAMDFNGPAPPASAPSYPNTGVLFPKLDGACGPDLKFMQQIQIKLTGDVYLFKYTVPNTCLGPSIITIPTGSWNVESNEHWTTAKSRFAQFLTLLTALGHTPDVLGILWTQGEGDYLVEGNDEAYLGLFRRFKREVRKFFEPYTITFAAKTIPWISALLFFTPLIGKYERQQNVRSAILKSGWNDPAFRVVDFQNFSVQSDLFHLDTPGVVAYGLEQYNAWINILQNNTMALEVNTLGSLRSALMREFGIEDDAAGQNKVIIDEKVNLAQEWLIGRRKNWPFMERIALIEVGEWTEGQVILRHFSALFTKGQNTCSFLNSASAVGPLVPATALDPPLAREFITFAEFSSERPIMLLGSIGSGLQLESRFKGDSQSLNVGIIIVGNPTNISVQSLTTATGHKVILPRNVSTFPVAILNVTGAQATLISNFSPLQGKQWFATRVDDDTFTIPVDTTGGVINSNTGTVQIGYEFLVNQGLFRLPEDYIRMHVGGAHLDSIFESLSFKSAADFERIRLSRDLQKTNYPIYTVVVDPIGLELDRKYLWLYPYMSGQDKIRVKYYGDIRKLVGDNDISDIPRSDRFALWYAACWLVASWVKNTDLVAFYRDGALNELERMAKEYQLSDDITEDQPAEKFDFDGPRPPSGFPEFQL